MSDDYIDPQRDIISANWSPQLKQVHPVIEPQDSPQPILTKDSSESDDSQVERSAGRRKRRKRRTQPLQSDVVLITQLDPNRPDIAQALKNGIDGGSDFDDDNDDEAEEEEEEEEGNDEYEDREVEEEGLSKSESDEDQMVACSPSKRLANPADARTKGLAAAALEVAEKFTTQSSPDDGDFPMFDTYSNSIDRATTQITNRQRQSLSNGVHINGGDSKDNSQSPYKVLDLKPPPRPLPPPLTTSSPSARKKSRTMNQNSPNDHDVEDNDDSIATSPTLAPYTINPEHADPASTLPALQRSPDRRYSVHLPENRQTLPSLTTALSQATDSNGTPFPSHSPSLPRSAASHLPHFGPSPSTYSTSSPGSVMSPPSLPSHASSYWRSTTRDGSISASSDHAPPPTMESTSNSSMMVQSPVDSYSMSTRSATEHSRQMSPRDENDESELSEMHQSNGIIHSSATYVSGGYKCNIPDCNSAPFQTQYLLNSHMNVHSNTRPHFCPVKGCSRGPGGQGFKRKNEMIRHGLVHTSPGYMCPFCPDQQHKYPRPDNLQRHVKVHHKDRDREDPLLREVLAQRPEGGNRGRRRRLGSG